MAQIDLRTSIMRYQSVSMGLEYGPMRELHSGPMRELHSGPMRELVSGGKIPESRGQERSVGGMLPRKVFHTKPGSGSSLRSEVINTSSSSSSSASWMIQELCTERILDTARSGSAASRRELEIPQSVKVSRQVTSRLLRNIRFLSKARKNLDKLQLTRQSVENVGHVHVTKVVFHYLHFHF